MLFTHGKTESGYSCVQSRCLADIALKILWSQLFRITKDVAKRARLIQESHYGCLASKVKEKMTRTPQSGLVRQSRRIPHIFIQLKITNFILRI